MKIDFTLFINFDKLLITCKFFISLLYTNRFFIFIFNIIIIFLSNEVIYIKNFDDDYFMLTYIVII